jgi:hypothetical protein
MLPWRVLSLLCLLLRSLLAGLRSRRDVALENLVSATNSMLPFAPILLPA